MPALKTPSSTSKCRSRAAHGLQLVRRLAAPVRLVVLVGLTCLVMLVGAHPVGAAPKITSFFLDNQLQVVVIEDHRAPIVTHMVWYKVGAADEPPGKSGVAHFLEHMMFKGTERLEAGEFSRIVARNGGTENAFTSYDFTGYFQKIAAERLALVMELEADRMVNLQIGEQDVATELEVVIEERRSRVDNSPTALMSEQLSAAQYLAHPYGVPLIGWSHELPQLARRDVLNFYETYYAPNNAVVVVSGDVFPEDVRVLAKRFYGALKPAEIPPRVRPQEPPQIAARRLLMTHALVEQPGFRRTYLAPSYIAGTKQHAVPLEVLAMILGDGTTSRLYQSLVVESKLAVSAGAWYSPDNLDQTVFGLYASPSPGIDLAALEAGIDNVLQDVLLNGVSGEETERAKQKLLAQAIYSWDSAGAMARIYGIGLTAGLTVGEIADWSDRVADVSIAQIHAAARAILSPVRSVTGWLLPEGALAPAGDADSPGAPTDVAGTPGAGGE